MKKLIIIAVLFLSLIGCSNGGSNHHDDDSDVISFGGKIEKGALQKGANITASEWSAVDGYSGHKEVYFMDIILHLIGRAKARAYLRYGAVMAIMSG